MAKLLDSVKALGEAITGEKIEGDTLFEAVKDAGEKMTGKEIEGKELNDLIAETAKEYQGGGGTVVVDELPETGEANTIYELHEQVEPAYNWVAMVTNQMQSDNVGANSVFIFDTYEQMVGKINSLRVGTIQINGFGCYIRNEDKLYIYEMGEVEGTWNIQECEKVSSYKFEVFSGNFVCVLRSYEGLDESDNKYYGTLYDGTKVELGWDDPQSETSDGTMGFILHQVTFERMRNFAGCTPIIPVTTLPTAEEAVAKYLDDLITGNGELNVDLGSQIKYNSNGTHIYHWSENNFYEYAESGPEPVYTGPLEWYTREDSIYLEMPYQELLDNVVYDWIFQPEQGGDKVSYWVYANNVWTNTEDIGKPVEQEVVYGELLKGATFDTDNKLISPYTNEQICNYIREGKPVILRYHKDMGENEFMYVYINGFKMDVEYVNQPLQYGNFTCRHFDTTDRISYNYEYDYFYYNWGE